MKSNKRRQIPKSNSSLKTSSSKKKKDPLSFFRFIFSDAATRRYLIAGVVIFVVYAIVLRWLFPRPSYFFDSGTYIQAARDNSSVSFRPQGYSEFIRFFHDIYISSTLLVVAQFACNVLANLFLFFTFVYFFPLSKWYRVILFLLLLCNPLYLFYSNYILSEAFFCSLTVIWITVLTWILRRPNWFNFIAQLILLDLLFKLRYNALFYPFLTTAAYIISNQELWKKALGILLSFSVIAMIVHTISSETEKVTGYRVFSAFGGWQMASNALNILKHANTDMDINSFSSVESKEIYLLTRHYFDTLKPAKPAAGVVADEITASYLWDPNAPLKEYMNFYANRKRIKIYFVTWTAVGPVFSDFGKEVIIKNPFKFARYFLWPNTKLYWWPQMEAYQDYNYNLPAVDKVIKEYYQYLNDKVDLKHAWINNLVMRPWKYLFPFINALFLGLVAVYFIKGKYKGVDRFFTITLMFVTGFCLCNFLFSIAVAPTVFRYQVVIITLCVIFCAYLTQYIFQDNKQAGKLKNGIQF
jgi:hypothetical protein